MVLLARYCYLNISSLCWYIWSVDSINWFAKMLEKKEEEERLDWEAVVAEFESLTTDACRVQKETLKKILEENGDTEYLLKCGLNGSTDPDSFKACIPVVTHNDLEPYIHRISDGEKSSILTGKPITTISLRYIHFLIDQLHYLGAI